MQQKLIAFILLTTTLVLGCKNQEKADTSKIFNEGITLSLEAGKLAEAGDDSLAIEKYKAAIEKFKQTIEIDSLHRDARSALGFANYEIKEFGEAKNWFQKAVDANPNSAIDYQYLGLSYVNVGDLGSGKQFLDQAHQLNASPEMLQATIDNLLNIGQQTFAYGEGYKTQGDTQKAVQYKQLGINTLIIAYDYSQKRTEIKKLLEAYAAKMKDPVLTDWLKKN